MTNKKIIENGNWRVLLPKLHNLKEFDKEIEAKRKFWGKASIISGVIAFASLFFIALLPFLAITCAIGVLFFIPSLIIYIAQTRKDMDNRKLDLAIKFMDALHEDIPNDQNVSILIDFGDYRKNGKLIKKEKDGMFSSVTLFNYEHEWFKCAGELYDENRFEVGITKYIDRKEKSKRKYTKVKEKIVEKATLDLKLNARIYPAPETVASAVKTGMLPHGISVSRCLGKNRTVKIVAVTPPAVIVKSRSGAVGDESSLFTGDKLLGLIIDAYSGLQKARPVASSAP